MPALDRTLPELAEQLLGCGDPSLLDGPLDRVPVGHDEARDLLRAIHEAGDARSLRELLSGEGLERWISGAATPSEEETLRAQVARWLGVGQVGDDDPARLARVAPLPRDLEGVLAWARPYDLLGELTRPAHEVLHDTRALSAKTTLIECCLGQLDVPPGASLLGAHRAEEDARAYLVREAGEYAALAAREALWKVALVEGALRRLAERLRGAIAGTAVRTLATVRFVPARLVTVDGATGVARGVLAGAQPITARLLLSGHEQRAIEGTCDQCARPGCLHVRALAARLLDACHDESDRLHGPLCELVEVPSWKRFLRALAPDAERAGSTTERIAFRVRLDGERASVGAVVQTLAGGRWSAGKLVSPLELTRSAAVTERDRPVLDVLALGARTRSAQLIPADPVLLRALVEHPLVLVEGSDELVRVREESVHVALAEQPDGLVPSVSLGGVPVPPGPRAREAYLLQHDRRDSLVFAALTPSLRRLLAALASFRGVLPPESYPTLAPWLASIAQVARVSAPSVLRGTERPASGKLLLRIAPAHDEGIDLTLSFRALPMGPLWPPGQGPELCHGLEEGVSVFARRDLARERALAAEVIEALGLERQLRLEPFGYRVANDQAALEVLSTAARLADRLALEWAESARRLTVSATIRASDLSIDLRKRGAWLGVGGSARAGELDVAIGRVLDAARRRERFVAIEGGDHVEIERALFERLARASLCVTESLREPAISSAAAGFFVDALGEGVEGADESTRAWLARARGVGEPVAIDPAWSARLRDYQREGVAWLLARSQWAPGACLADEMGLGKTVQAIALLEARAALGPAIVIAPTSVTDNWARELARFAPSLEVRMHRVSRRALGSELGPGVVLVTSYDLLLRDRERLAGVAFATQIVDEAQMVKNARTQRASAVTGIDAAFRVALSGTPIENRLGDLWSLFQVIAPGLLGSWARFRARFAVPIERYQDEERAALLRSMVAPFVLRRTKRDVAPELPARTEVVHRIELSQAEQDLYDGALREARRAMAKRRRDEGRTVQILAELTRLRQLACHPRLVVDDDRVESSKMHALVRLLDDVLPRGHRVLVFSQFTRHLALAREAIEARGVRCLYLDGATPAGERTRLVDRFQEHAAQVFLISLKAGGTGLNLTAADYVVHLDPWWNPAAEDQASDRAHRIGQERPTTIVRLVAQGTIEERVLALHDDKRALAQSILAEGASAPLDLATLESLLAG